MITLVVFPTESGLDYIAREILSFLDVQTLCRAEQTCKTWQKVRLSLQLDSFDFLHFVQAIASGGFWRRAIERNVRGSKLWRGIASRRGWLVVILSFLVIGKFLTQATSHFPAAQCDIRFGTERVENAGVGFHV